MWRWVMLCVCKCILTPVSYVSIGTQSILLLAKRDNYWSQMRWEVIGPLLHKHIFIIFKQKTVNIHADSILLICMFKFKLNINCEDFNFLVWNVLKIMALSTTVDLGKG